MLLAIDIGNTNTSFGVFDNRELVAEWSLESVRGRTSDEIGVLLRLFFSNAEFDHKTISAIVISSVVDELDRSYRKMSESYFGISAFFVDHTFDFGFEINYRPPSGIGIDRLVGAFGAVEKYGFPCIVCDFGTATTIDAVNSKKEYLGGAICPGMVSMSDSLFEKTSKLPRVQVIKPKKIIGDTTVSSIQSGIYFGYIALVDGLISRMVAEMEEKPLVISTGGLADLIAEGSEFVKIVDRTLILEGLRLVFEKRTNQFAKS